MNPLNGDWAMPTLGTALRYFPAAFSTRAYRSTDSLVLVGLEGRAEIFPQGKAQSVVQRDGGTGPTIDMRIPVLLQVCHQAGDTAVYAHSLPRF